MPTPSTGLSLPDLEQVYDTLAETLDRAPEGKRELLLVKLALLQAQALGDRASFDQLAATALLDL
jgi:hypothetical protein